MADVMGWVVMIGFVLCFAGLVGVYALLVQDFARGLERQRQHRLELEARLRRKGII